MKSSEDQTIPKLVWKHNNYPVVGCGNFVWCFFILFIQKNETH